VLLSASAVRPEPEWTLSQTICANSANDGGRRTGVSQGSAARNRVQALALNHNAARGAGKVNKAVCLK
jgi:hypothetical protein